MQGHDWNDLRYLLALHRAGSLVQAARLLGVNETTVARRLRGLETALGLRLVGRDATRGLLAGETARRLIALAETVERGHAAFAEAAGQATGEISGTVRITAVPVVVNRILIPHLASLQAKHPFLCIDLLPETRNADLTRREADLALRLARPATGGLEVKARRIGTLRYAAYGPAAGGGETWILYDEARAHLPQARWLKTVAATASRLRVSDTETALEAVAAGLGQTLLPRLVADQDPRLGERTGDLPPAPDRPVWLLSAEETPDRPAMAAVKDWLAALPWSE